MLSIVMYDAQITQKGLQKTNRFLLASTENAHDQLECIVKSDIPWMLIVMTGFCLQTFADQW